MNKVIFSHPPEGRRVTYVGGICPASASTLCTSSLKPLHGIISYCTCILVYMVYLIFVKKPLKTYGGFCEFL